MVSKADLNLDRVCYYSVYGNYLISLFSAYSVAVGSGFDTSTWDAFFALTLGLGITISFKGSSSSSFFSDSSYYFSSSSSVTSAWLICFAAANTGFGTGLDIGALWAILGLGEGKTLAAW